MDRVMEGRSASAEVTALIVDWIRAQRAAGESQPKIGKALGVSKTAVQHLLDGARNAGNRTETNFAAKFYGGSIDALRKDAKSRFPQPVQAKAVLQANLAEAVALLRARGEVSDAAIEKARRIGQAGGDLTVHTWLMVLIDLGQIAAQEAPPSSSRAR